MARNRKRAKERRARRPQPVGRPAREGATARDGATQREEAIQREAPARGEAATEREAPTRGEAATRGEAPSVPAPEPTDVIAPLAHAAPDAEIAEEQVELGAIEQETDLDGGEPRDDQAFEALAEDQADFAQEDARAAIVAAREPRAVPGNRLLTFLQGSWAELQRVQWPDRRQVMQATGVVIGFVIVAGLFLGAADWAAKHLVNYILQGHF
jgi:preprotein translocase subunit SecE